MCAQSGNLTEEEAQERSTRVAGSGHSSTRLLHIPDDANLRVLCHPHMIKEHILTGGMRRFDGSMQAWRCPRMRARTHTRTNTHLAILEGVANEELAQIAIDLVSFA